MPGYIALIIIRLKFDQFFKFLKLSQEFQNGVEKGNFALYSYSFSITNQVI